MSELKLTQVELFSLFHFKSAAINVPKYRFLWLFKQLMNAFYTILTFQFNL